ncbi:outer membrane beta-barrel protein [Microbulbifer echini]|uniref:Outer membrane beta-barrel protein n=1 Tax=Microbulbifer echini TaxID=1529067 RepID=A0ABV4NJ02_9GAMM|nr:outer membrane beta-barrel protein [uncultured Microbulbifer sp.]
MKRFILASAIAFSASNTTAMENSFYLKSSYGKVDTDISAQEARDTFGTKLSDPNGWSFTLGYRLNNFFAVEGGYADLGEAEAKDSQNVFIPDSYGTYYFDSSYKATIDAQTKMLGVFLSTDTSKTFYAGLRAGYQVWDAELKQSGSFSERFEWNDEFDQVADDLYYQGDFSNNETTDGTDLYYGVSAGWNYNNWSLSLEHTIFEMDDRKPSLSSLALTYNF